MQLFLGIDPGYRYTDSVSRMETLSIPSVTSMFFPNLTASGGFRSGVLLQPIEGMAGNTAVKQGENPDSEIRANKNFSSATRTELSFHTKTLIFHAIRAHIPQETETADVYLCLAVPRAEYDIAIDKNGLRYSPVERAFAQILEREWTVQNDGGKVCRVTIRKVKVKPQPELALYSQILKYDKHLDKFFHADTSWMYQTTPQDKRFPSLQDREERLAQAVQTVVFDIGSFTSHAERLTVIESRLTAVKSVSKDIGMWTLLPEIRQVIERETGENHLAAHQLMKIFETGVYGDRSFVPEFQQILIRHWPKYDRLFRSSFTSFAEVDKVLCVGRGWMKFDDLFRRQYHSMAQKHTFEVVFPEKFETIGTLIAEGAFKQIRGWYEQTR